jgi:hypothetical protein
VSSVRKARARLSDLELVSARCGLPAVLCGCALTAWTAVLALDAGDITLPGLCAPLAPGSGAASVKLLLTFNPPWMLVIGWALMIAAMTPPLLVAPLRYVGDHSFARRRKRMMTLCCTGYTTAWMMAGIALLPLSLLWHVAAATSAMPLLTGLTVAFAWQISPVKQRCLNGSSAAGLGCVRVGGRPGCFCFWTKPRRLVRWGMLGLDGTAAIRRPGSSDRDGGGHPAGDSRAARTADGTSMDTSSATQRTADHSGATAHAPQWVGTAGVARSVDPGTAALSAEANSNHHRPIVR